MRLISGGLWLGFGIVCLGKMINGEPISQGAFWVVYIAMMLNFIVDSINNKLRDK